DAYHWYGGSPSPAAHHFPQNSLTTPSPLSVGGLPHHGEQCPHLLSAPCGGAASAPALVRLSTCHRSRPHRNSKSPPSSVATKKTPSVSPPSTASAGRATTIGRCCARRTWTW